MIGALYHEYYIPMAAFYDLPKLENRSKSLSECIRQEMHKQGGSLSFATFMEFALYHPMFGYYNADTFNIGKHGDFTTAAEISPLYAHCFARAVLPILIHLKQHTLLEIGAGSGLFAHDLLRELDNRGLALNHYYIYEISPNLRKQQQDFLRSTCPDFFPFITWLDTMPAHFTGTIIANEVLDALPVHCFRIEGIAPKEKCVTWKKNEFVWTLCEPTTPELTAKAKQLRECYALENGYESEINLNLKPFIHSITQTLSKGIILFADYGYGRQEYYHPERRQGTLTCFYQHRHHHNPLIMPGLQDITAHVDFTRVAEQAVENHCSLAGYTSQAAFLLACGLMDMAVEKEKNLSPSDEFQLHQSIKLLTLPSEMGERIKIMALAKNMELSLLGFGLQDRRRDL